MIKIKEKGFTLIELLIVIAVIVVLAGVLIFAINPASVLAKARDAKRLSDMESMVQAMNLALAEGELALTITTGNSGEGTQFVDGTGYMGYDVVTGKTGLGKYIPTLPLDPTNAIVATVNYVYSFGSTTTNFEINAVMEHVDNAAKMSTDGGNESGVFEVGTSLTVMP